MFFLDDKRSSLEKIMATQINTEGVVEISFQFRRHIGGKYIHGSVALRFEDQFPYEFVSTAVWPTTDNYETAVREAIEEVLMRRFGALERTRVTLREINWDDVASCESGFRRAAIAAAKASFDF